MAGPQEDNKDTFGVELVNPQSKEFVEVAVGLPVRKPFHYRVPASLKEKAETGKRAWVPFGTRKIVGYITGFVDKPQVEGIKEILSVIDEEAPVINAELLALTKWIAGYYHSSWGEAIEAALPGPLKKGKIKTKPRHPLTEEEYEPSGNFKPTHEQDAALRSIRESISKGKNDVYLLHGITGSGKTEVYMQSIESALNLGRSAIVLVPEISLTPQAVERFKSRFGGIVAVLHSRLLESERFLEWKKLRDGTANIAVGARSAIFAPVKNLGLIVIDEEHETSYKQDDAPRYNARDVAIERAGIAGAAVILGSATPSIESFQKAASGEYKLLKITERIEKRALPKVDIIDMRQELIDSREPKIFSRALEHAISQVLNRRGQVMLFMNRRGFSTFINCKKCGYVVTCKYCNVSMTYHFDTKKLNCHYCNYQVDPPEKCPKCKGGDIRYFGIGTQKIESEAARLFPAARIARMDTDATSKRGSHRQILTEFKKHKIDILIGTQMIAKGHDFPRVTLVGVVSADTALNLPDFRAGERTFNLLTQVAGRAGRGSEPGRVIIQTFSPNHYAIEKSIEHDYVGFFNEEIKFRRELNYPPFTHIIEIKLRGRKEERVIKAAHDLAAVLNLFIAGKAVEMVGPAPEFISKIKGQFRWNLLLKGEDPAAVCGFIDKALDNLKGKSGLIITVDVDPMGM
ncbi:MAG: primosomal protein N' [Candidatus Omnitrophica bacterium]|nr:primosomal protein N' [Candidatus Omnitrophota bacterium]